MVTVTGPGGRQEHVTGADGAYMAAGLAPGDYVVTAALPGFEAVEIPVSFGAGATETIPIVRQIMRLLETVSEWSPRRPGSSRATFPLTGGGNCDEHRRTADTRPRQKAGFTCR